jgi:hypothetical protein
MPEIKAVAAGISGLSLAKESSTMPTKNQKGFLLATLMTATLASNATATVMEPATFEEKVGNAASVVLGKVVSTESRWDSEHRWILTYSTFAVEKAMKGSASGQLTLVTPGGAVGDVHQDTIGVPQFNVGSEHVVFVKETRIGPTVLYFDQGAYDVIRDSRGQRIVAPMESGAVMKTASSQSVGVQAESAKTIEQFEQAVRSTQRGIQQKSEMEMVRGREAASTSITAILMRNRGLVALALAGLAFATWQLLRKS